MARAIWSGAISFGLVMVPVKVYSAVSRKDVRFNQLHGDDGGRIQQKRVCSIDGEEVPYEEIVKGYEIEPGPLRDDHARRARGRGRRAHAPDRDRGVRRARRHRPDPLGVDVLPRARQDRGQAVRAAAGGAREHLARRARPRRPALQGVPRRDPAGAGRADALDDAVRRRDRAARGRRGVRRGDRPRSPPRSSRSPSSWSARSRPTGIPSATRTPTASA